MRRFRDRDRNDDPLFPSSVFRGRIGASGASRLARYRDDAEQIDQASMRDIVIVVLIMVMLMLAALCLL